MSRQEIHFNYKSEYRRAWSYIVAPMALTFIVHFVLLLSLLQPKTDDIVFYTIFAQTPYILRNLLTIINLYPLIAFIRNLYDRFDALNSFLRFTYNNFPLKCHRRKYLN